MSRVAGKSFSLPHARECVAMRQDDPRWMGWGRIAPKVIESEGRELAHRSADTSVRSTLVHTFQAEPERVTIEFGEMRRLCHPSEKTLNWSGPQCLRQPR
jgi:hypothetical protein